MEKKNTNYNKMAPFYNKITNIISEGGNIRSQRYFLQFIKEQYRVLNVGCGSVQFNIDIAQSSNKVTAVDIAPKMIDIAKCCISANHLNERVNFVCSDIMDYKSEEKYDAVFANFMLNTFEWNYSKKVLNYLCSFVKKDGILCIADEHIADKKLQRLSQKIFRPSVSWIHHIWAGHPLHEIYDYCPVLEEIGFKRIHFKVDKSGIICSSVYKKI